MEIRTLRYFLAVAREENMTRAAETLHVTQPTLSKALKALEDELGKKLYTRHSFSIKLTNEGILLRNRAEDLVSMADKIEREFTTLDDITAGDLYFGLAESYQISYLAREIHAFKQPGRSMHSSRIIRGCATTSPVATRSRSWRSWTKDCWISLFWQRRRTRSSMNRSSSRSRIHGALSCRRTIRLHKKRPSGWMT